MSRVGSIQDVVRLGLCVSCGACASAAPPGTIRMVFDRKRATFIPEITDSGRVSGRGPELTVCPGKGLPIKSLATELYGEAANDSFELGRYRSAFAVRAVDPRILENASSGGIMTEIARYLIENKLVEGVTASRFAYGPPGPRTESLIARTFEDLLSAQGSKYCPTATNQLIRQCVEAGGRYLFSGTPCQVAALRLAMREDRLLRQVFPCTMANFCGGFHNFRRLEDLIRFDGIAPAEVEYLRFRGGGQPGSMLIRSRDGRVATAPYPDYLRRSDVPKNKRCTYCVDATGELADFACGDAWIDRFLKTEYSWSVVLARSEFAEQIVGELASKGRIETMPVSSEEIRDSQQKNINSKKYRQYKRMQISRLLGIAIPEWGQELPRGNGSYLHEIKVLIGKTAPGRRMRRIRNLVKGSSKKRGSEQ